MENRQRHQTPSAQTDGGIGNGGITERQRLTALALRLLSIRPYSCQEVTRRLLSKSSNPGLVSEIITRLKDQKLLDDAKFAQWVVESRSRTRPRGRRLLTQELKSKGIDSVTINDNLMTADDEILLAQSALQKKAKAWSGLSAQSYQLKAKNHLYSRGFSWNVIETAVKTAYNQQRVK